jgi:hypothetical protein
MDDKKTDHQLNMHKDRISRSLVRRCQSFEKSLDSCKANGHTQSVDVNKITAQQISEIYDYTDVCIPNRTEVSVNGGKDTPLLMQKLLYILSGIPFNASGKIPHNFGRTRHESKLTCATFLLLKIFVEDRTAFSKMVGFAPAGEILKVLELKPTLAVPNSTDTKVSINVDMVESILYSLVEQISYATTFSAGQERHLTLAAATLIRNVLLGEPLALVSKLGQELCKITDYDFTDRQYGVFFGVIYGGALMLLQDKR